MVAAAVIGGAALSTAGSVGTGLMQSSNASKAAATSQRNLELMLPQIQQNYVQQQGLYQPFYGAGQQGLGAETDLLGLNGSDAASAAMANFQASPGYQYQLQQGLRGVDAGAASRGMLRSGSTIKAEETLGQNLANQDFGNYFSRINALAAQGLTAAGDLGAAGNNLIAGMQGNATSQNALAIGGANAQNSILGNTSQGVGNQLNTLLNSQTFQNLINPSGGGGLFSNQTVGDYSIPGTSALGPYGSLFGSPAAGTGGGFNNAADLVGAGGGITIPPIPPVGQY